MYRSEWEFEQHARHMEREAMAAAERARLVVAAQAATGQRGSRFMDRLRAVGSGLEAWVAGTPRRPSAVPAPCRERAA